MAEGRRDDHQERTEDLRRLRGHHARRAGYVRVTPLIIYSYEVDGEAYRGTRLSFVHENLLAKSSAEDALQHYPLDQTVTVFYNPGDPRDAVLDPERSGRYRLRLSAFVLVGWLCTAIAIYVALTP